MSKAWTTSAFRSEWYKKEKVVCTECKGSLPDHHFFWPSLHEDSPHAELSWPVGISHHRLDAGFKHMLTQIWKSIGKAQCSH